MKSKEVMGSKLEWELYQMLKDIMENQDQIAKYLTHHQKNIEIIMKKPVDKK